jgi:oxalate decarboxylase/phosphoglucose isomerase-like protein (cupin superfamily)
MKDVLKNPQEKGPDIHYYMIRGGKEKKNVTVWDNGTVGDEYIKAYGHYHVDGIPETYWIVEGEGILLLQKRKKLDGNFIDNELESCTAIFVKTGDKIDIAGDEGHAMINTGNTWLVTVDDSPISGTSSKEISKPRHADYEPIKKMHGFGYYVVKNSQNKPEFIKNPLYKNLPDIIVKNA